MAKRKTKSIREIVSTPENTWAEYHVKELKPKYTVYRFDSGGHRFYFFKDGDTIKTAMGVTSAFGIVSTERESINKWKEKYTNWKHLLNVSAEYGTLEHMLHGDIMLGKGVNKEYLKQMTKIALDNDQSGDMPLKDTLAFLKFQEDFKLTPLLIEAQLIWRDPETNECLAMTIDLLAKMTITTKNKREVEDGVYQRGEKKGESKYKTVVDEITEEKIVLVDFKSNFFEKEKKTFYETHKCQLMAAQLAVEQNFGIKVDGGVWNYSPNAWIKNPGYTFYRHEVSDEDIKVFDAYWRLIQAKGINTPKGNILVCDEFKDSNDFKLLSYQEYAEQVLLKKEIVC